MHIRCRGMHVTHRRNAELPDFVMVLPFTDYSLNVKDRVSRKRNVASRLENPLIIVRTDLIVCMQSKHLRYSNVYGRSDNVTVGP